MGLMPSVWQGLPLGMAFLLSKEARCGASSRRPFRHPGKKKEAAPEASILPAS